MSNNWGIGQSIFVLSAGVVVFMVIDTMLRHSIHDLFEVLLSGGLIGLLG